MPLTTLLTPNFQIQYDPADYPAPGELAAAQQRAQALVNGCEPDYAVLCERFGVAMGTGLGALNRVFVTLTKTVRGGSNGGYSKSHPRMSVNPEIGSTDDKVMAIFVAEMIEIMMSYKGPWNPGDSGGEGISRVAAQILHPQYGAGFVNAWLASDPTTDPSSAVADSEFRKDWVSRNFTGGPLRAGGTVRGDDDSYSYGCAMLFIYYLKSQLGFSMAEIVQHAGPTLAATYQALTLGQTKGFWEFRSLLAEHFPIGVESPTDDPFPLIPVQPRSNTAPSAGVSGNTTALVVTGTDQRILYKWWDLGDLRSTASGSTSTRKVGLSWGNACWPPSGRVTRRPGLCWSAAGLVVVGCWSVMSRKVIGSSQWGHRAPVSRRVRGRWQSWHHWSPRARVSHPGQ
jgi:hypothetical protein